MDASVAASRPDWQLCYLQSWSRVRSLVFLPGGFNKLKNILRLAVTGSTDPQSILDKNDALVDHAVEDSTEHDEHNESHECFYCPVIAFLMMILIAGGG